MCIQAGTTLNGLVDRGYPAYVERCSNRLLRANPVEMVNVACMVFVESEKVMGLYAAHVIGAEDHVATDFLLNANVHLNRAWSAEAWIVHIQTEAETLIQQRSHVVWVRCGETEGRVRLVLSLKVDDLVRHSSDRNWIVCEDTSYHRTAKHWLQRSSGDGNWLWSRGPAARRRCLDKNVCGGRPKCGITWIHDREDVLVKQANAATNRSFTLASRVPGEPQLGCEIQVRLLDPTAQPWHQHVELRNRRKFTVAAASVAHVAEPVGHCQILSPLRTGANIRSKTRVRKTAGRNSQSRGWREIAETVTHVHIFHRIVERVSIATGERAVLCERLLRRADICADSGKVGRYKACGHDTVEIDAVAQDVLANGFASIVFELIVALQHCGSGRSWASDQSGATHVYIQQIVSQRQATACCRIGIYALHFQILESDAVGVTPRREIQTDNMDAGDVLRAIQRETGLRVCHEPVLEVAKSDRMRAPTESVENPPCPRGYTYRSPFQQYSGQFDAPFREGTRACSCCSVRSPSTK